MPPLSRTVQNNQPPGKKAAAVLLVPNTQRILRRVSRPGRAYLYRVADETNKRDGVRTAPAEVTGVQYRFHPSFGHIHSFPLILLQSKRRNNKAGARVFDRIELTE